MYLLLLYLLLFCIVSSYLLLFFFYHQLLLYCLSFSCMFFFYRSLYYLILSFSPYLYILHVCLTFHTLPYSFIPLRLSVCPSVLLSFSPFSSTFPFTYFAFFLSLHSCLWFYVSHSFIFLSLDISFRQLSLCLLLFMPLSLPLEHHLLFFA